MDRISGYLAILPDKFLVTPDIRSIPNFDDYRCSSPGPSEVFQDSDPDHASSLYQAHAHVYVFNVAVNYKSVTIYSSLKLINYL